MLKHWTTRRKASLLIHSIVVLIPFSFATVSAALFWNGLFHSWWIAVPMVAVIDVLSLLGLALFIWRVPSPFQRLRHVLPFVSIVPLGYELWRILAPHNDALVAIGVSLLVTAILVGVAQRCYVTIEQLFVDPLQAAQELAEEQAAHERQRAVHAAIVARQRMTQQVHALTDTLSAMAEQQDLAVSAVQEWSRRPQLRILPAPADTPAWLTELARHAPDDTEAMPGWLTELTERASPDADVSEPAPFALADLIDDAPPAPLTDAERLDQARRLRQAGTSWRATAHAVGVSDATLRRKLAREEE